MTPPVNKQADRRAGPAKSIGFVQPVGHEVRPAALIHLVACKVWQGFVRGHRAVFLIGGFVLLCRRTAAGGVGRVSDDGVKHAVLHLAHQAQAVAVQNRPAVAAGVFGHFKFGLRAKYNVGFGSFGQRHLPFLAFGCVPKMILPSSVPGDGYGAVTDSN